MDLDRALSRLSKRVVETSRLRAAVDSLLEHIDGQRHAIDRCDEVYALRLSRAGDAEEALLGEDAVEPLLQSHRAIVGHLVGMREALGHISGHLNCDRQRSALTPLSSPAASPFRPGARPSGGRSSVGEPPYAGPPLGAVERWLARFSSAQRSAAASTAASADDSARRATALLAGARREAADARREAAELRAEREQVTQPLVARLLALLAEAREQAKAAEGAREEAAREADELREELRRHEAEAEDAEAAHAVEEAARTAAEAEAARRAAESALQPLPGPAAAPPGPSALPSAQRLRGSLVRSMHLELAYARWARNSARAPASRPKRTPRRAEPAPRASEARPHPAQRAAPALQQQRADAQRGALGQHAALGATVRSALSLAVQTRAAACRASEAADAHAREAASLAPGLSGAWLCGRGAEGGEEYAEAERSLWRSEQRAVAPPSVDAEACGAAVVALWQRETARLCARLEMADSKAAAAGRRKPALPAAAVRPAAGSLEAALPSLRAALLATSQLCGAQREAERARALHTAGACVVRLASHCCRGHAMALRLFHRLRSPPAYPDKPHTPRYPAPSAASQLSAVLGAAADAAQSLGGESTAAALHARAVLRQLDADPAVRAGRCGACDSWCSPSVHFTGDPPPTPSSLLLNPQTPRVPSRAQAAVSLEEAGGVRTSADAGPDRRSPQQAAWAQRARGDNGIFDLRAPALVHGGRASGSAGALPSGFGRYSDGRPRFGHGGLPPAADDLFGGWGSEPAPSCGALHRGLHALPASPATSPMIPPYQRGRSFDGAPRGGRGSTADSRDYR